ncbi:saccharopine dehydrogenase family protein [Luteipulveratus flavus]|uniref:Saccharopine dehydrogenase NADP-binding domain-containing protein n=1 Tax=Luteipulveratus flavus TaxID=3031728 RepID=A0ABT6C7I9_9MICO|nr:saccharopine dehydrogenase NADP-binding domain-containing protein [Luteipulveratus sp. YIM 133296]MDF8263246.1 saccharopine dehydrogenase NADP-binding domain-containing protein [Luteipulveratus sp. YIM 133296]
MSPASASRPTRDLHVVLYGATGFVGRLTARHLAAAAPEGTRIGLAGRSRERLEKVRTELGANAADWELIVADATDTASLAALAERTQVVITTVGPYASYGLPLVEACARTGTDYVDLTGEVLFVRKSIDRVQEIAEASGARIVHSCGFDSVPSDLAVMLAAKQAQADGAGELTDTTLYATLKGGFSGGTIASARQQLDEIRGDKAARSVALDKFALSPDRAAEPKGEWKDSAAVRHSDEIRSWTAPFVMAMFNTRIVRRSNALLGHAYGKGFRYREVMRTGDGTKGRATAYAVAGALGAGFAALNVPLLRPVTDRLLPSPGEGPSEKAQVEGFFRMEVRTTTTDGSQYRSIVGAQGDPGYAATAVMLGESALCLALERDRCPLPAGMNGGVLTPATALGDVLVDRLRAKGFTCTAERV